MFNQFLDQAIILDVTQKVTLDIRLAEEMSDFAVLQFMHTPLLELIVNRVERHTATIAIRALPFLTVSECQPAHLDASHRISVHSLLRTKGQGLRYYRQLAMAPKLCATALRNGLSLTLKVNDGVYICNDEHAKFEVVPLEQDVRVFEGPRALMMARELISRSYDYDKKPEMIAVHMSELDMVSRELTDYLASEAGKLHSGLRIESVRLESQITEKRQWLHREYSRAIERSHLSGGANEDWLPESPGAELSAKKRLRMLECYQLLAPKEVTELVQQMMEEDHL
ncbi:hypothetical protein [Shewanella gelidii]|uniref:Uncharacterized protein n=1 Tax=Shewanella gelidii TaxID=1642821 RepID=A0A917JX05_9GAMM|nr:hypothetical protein [Shewanella gelidii]MCL1099706.1 hypothetical protein [Shewanella gelidii]GGI89236.1 hypothetical protein GCM10009332_28280 [Shewanella gelidii]